MSISDLWSTEDFVILGSAHEIFLSFSRKMRYNPFVHHRHSHCACLNKMRVFVAHAHNLVVIDWFSLVPRAFISYCACSTFWPRWSAYKSAPASPIRLISGNGARPRSNYGWFSWRKETFGRITFILSLNNIAWAACVKSIQSIHRIPVDDVSARDWRRISSRALGIG